ncbi:electron transfer flavoprotein subunit beta/FixA family protein [Metaclostridioides mangenotii]|uniref:electron transfer flavoprotein subunit beta/FixA family protein n=1 Tax=Metaclostridioides mangenotii TaxID=1540 RepID=UPI0028E40158|nr:electron transfer flavoprotein subunit beta/FixA family protein [Clostridioides mangenotii]
MNILVCVKQVPDTTEVRLDPKTGTLIRDGVPSIINPDDKAGIEEAVRIKEKIGATVTVLSMGPPQAKNALEEAIAMGADRAILLTDRAFAGADTLATSKTIAGAIKKLDYDLIIAGRQAIDGDTAQVGPQIANHLDIPSITYVDKLDVEGDYVVVNRAFEDGYQVIKAKMPILITTLQEMNSPRYMKVSRIYDCMNKDLIETWTLKDIDVGLEEIGLKGSPTKVKKSFTKGVKARGTVHDVDEREGASIIINALKEKHIITEVKVSNI